MKNFTRIASLLGLTAFAVLLIYAQLRNQTSPGVESYRVRWSDTTNVATTVDQFLISAIDTVARLDSNNHALFSYVWPYRPYLMGGFNIYDSDGGAASCTVVVNVYGVQKNTNGTLPRFGAKWGLVATDTFTTESDDAGELHMLFVTDSPGIFDYGLYEVKRIGASDTLNIVAQNSGRDD